MTIELSSPNPLESRRWEDDYPLDLHNFSKILGFARSTILTAGKRGNILRRGDPNWYIEVRHTPILVEALKLSRSSRLHLQGVDTSGDFSFVNPRGQTVIYTAPKK